jgi:hypothetical protein
VRSCKMEYGKCDRSHHSRVIGPLDCPPVPNAPRAENGYIGEVSKRVYRNLRRARRRSPIKQSSKAYSENSEIGHACKMPALLAL